MSRTDSPLSGKMIFNVGARRSGTLWLQRIVTAHPEVSAVPSETHLFSHGIAPLMERLQHAAQGSPQLGGIYVEREAALDAIRDLCDVVFAQHLEPGTSHLAERTPFHVLHLPLIAAIYPDGRFVHIIRDGRDVARSIAAQDWGPDTVAGAAAEWRDSVEAARNAGLGSDRYREIRYEDLFSDPEHAIDELYRWLDVPVSAQVLRQALAETGRQSNVDQFERPGVTLGKWRQSFTAQDLDAFERVAGELRASLGYEPAKPLAPAPSRGRSLWRRLVTRASSLPLVRRRRRALRPGPDDYAMRRLSVADEAVEALTSADSERLARLLAPDAMVRAISASGRAEAHGPQGLALLDTAGGLDGRQVVGDVHASPTSGYVFSIERDGRRRDRIVFVTVKSGAVTELSLYLLPLGPGDPAR